jgi:integrase
MPRTHLTDISIKKFAVPNRGQVTYSDATLPGFGVRISQGGARTFVLVHGDRRERITIGRYPIISLSQARTKAKRILAQRILDPDQQPTILFRDAVPLFIQTHCKQRNKPSTQAETERLLNRHFLPAFGQRSLDQISTRDVTDILDELLDTPGECNHAFTAARTFFRWAKDRRYISSTPLDGLKLPARSQSRERVLTDTELERIVVAARASGSYGVILQLLVLTGQRLNQIASLQSDFIRREERTIAWPSRLMKSNREHTIPYGDEVERILDALPTKGLLFPTRDGDAFNNWSTSKAAFDEKCPMPHWTHHDLRRTFATGMAKLDFPPHVIERILDHTSTTSMSAVHRIYNRHSYETQMREAMEKWEAKVYALAPIG